MRNTTTVIEQPATRDQDLLCAAHECGTSRDRSSSFHGKPTATPGRLAYKRPLQIRNRSVLPGFDDI